MRNRIIQMVYRFESLASLGRIAWLTSFLLLLCLAHFTNPNDQLIGNWLKYSKRLLVEVFLAITGTAHLPQY